MHFGRAVTCGPLNDDALAILRRDQHRARRQVKKLRTAAGTET